MGGVIGELREVSQRATTGVRVNGGQERGKVGWREDITDAAQRSVPRVTMIRKGQGSPVP